MSDLKSLVEAKTAEVQGLMTGLRRFKDASGLKVKSLTADILQAAIPLVRELVKDENRAALALMLDERGFSKPGRKDNMSHHALKIATSSFVKKYKDKEGEWKYDKTLTNYAPAVRYILTLDWADNEIAAKIVDYYRKEHGSALNGLQKADRIANPGPKVEDEKVSIGRALRSKLEVSEEDIKAIPAEETVVLVWCRVVEGELVMAGVLDDFKAARRAAAAAGRKINQKRINRADRFEAEVEDGEVEPIDIPSDTIQTLEDAA